MCRKVLLFDDYTLWDLFWSNEEGWRRVWSAGLNSKVSRVDQLFCVAYNCLLMLAAAAADRYEYKKVLAGSPSLLPLSKNGGGRGA